MHLWALEGPRGWSRGPGSQCSEDVRSRWNRKDQLGDGCQASGQGSGGHCRWAPTWDLGDGEGKSLLCYVETGGSFATESLGTCRIPVHTWLFRAVETAPRVSLLG